MIWWAAIKFTRPTVASFVACFFIHRANKVLMSSFVVLPSDSVILYSIVDAQLFFLPQCYITENTVTLLFMTTKCEWHHGRHSHGVLYIERYHTIFFLYQSIILTVLTFYNNFSFVTKTQNGKVQRVQMKLKICIVTNMPQLISIPRQRFSGSHNCCGWATPVPWS